ncbi:MAG: CehA/McbA family metallohydrolase [Candidatus Krumholzibacteriota bacterium]|nr:CehA/McbA family metallohydrolase [Candidatus Krumholzibacteriota bacterium]
MRRAIHLACLLALAAGAGAPAGVRAAQVRVVVLDAATGDTLAVRASVTDAAGVPRYPPLGKCFYQPVGVGYFYADGPFDVFIPDGGAVARFSHGFTYEERILDLAVAGDTTIEVSLPRAFEPPAGWRSADTHVHIAHQGGIYTLHPAGALTIASAEGLDAVFCLDNEWDFTGAPDTCSTADCVVWMSEERRSSSVGDLAFLGIDALVEPLWSDWWPTTASSADTVHARYPGAAVVAVHPVTTVDFDDLSGWPGVGLARAAPLHALTGAIDLIEIMSYSNCDDDLARDLWYRLLNCGFRIPAAAGSDACVNRLGSYPAGGVRTWVETGEGPLDPLALLDGMRAGRSFVSSGPLIPAFTIFNASMGDSLPLARGRWTVYGTVRAMSRWPIDRVEIVCNGETAVQFDLPAGVCRVDTFFYLPVDRSSWVAARVVGGDDGWIRRSDRASAHTNPIWLPMGGERIAGWRDAAGFVSWLDDLEALAEGEGTWPAPGDSARFFADLAAGREAYQALYEKATAADRVVPDQPAAGFLLRQNVPNPFAESTLIVFGRRPGLIAGAPFRQAAPVEIGIYDVAGRLVRRLWRGRIGEGETGVVWDGLDDGGRPAASGIYFCRLRTPAGPVTRKMALVR